METSPSQHVPAWYWIIAGLSVLWNAFGAMDYTLTQLRNADYLRNFPPEMIQMIDEFPVWATIAWALGVWGALAGSLLLLARRRFAVHAFLISLFGLAGSSFYQWQAGVFQKFGSPGMTFINLLIWGGALFLLWFANRQNMAGRLR